ncbi:unnamed protein product [Polarella glacialis]|uniref:Uncharacterized protein n=1 Tax=Polarella glacialis TaxID=89957 RepID=A0A813KZK7_POLGL|nr:unnamed protein product [Polarella glacialis]
MVLAELRRQQGEPGVLIGVLASVVAPFLKPAGRMAALTDEGKLTVLDLSSLEALQTRDLEVTEAGSLVVAPGGDHLYMFAFTQDGMFADLEILCFEQVSLIQVANIDIDASWVHCMALSPDGAQLAVSFRRRVHFIMAPALEDFDDSIINGYHATSMKYTPLGDKIVTLCSKDRLMQLLCVETCSVLSQVPLNSIDSTLKLLGYAVGHQETLVCCEFSAREGCNFRLLAVDPFAVIQDVVLLQDSPDADCKVTCCAFVHEYLAIGCIPAKVHLLDPASSAVKASASLTDTEHIFELEFVPSCQLIVAACNNAMYLLSAKDLAIVHWIRLPGFLPGVHRVHLAIDPLLISSVLIQSGITTEQVIQPVLFEEPAAYRDSELLRMQADSQWADDVEFLIGRDTASRSAGSGSRLLLESSAQDEGSSLVPSKDALFMAEFSRCPQELLDALRTGLPLKACRMGLEAEGHNFELTNGTMVFTHARQYLAAMTAQLPQTKKICVIFSESLEYLVEESIQHIGMGAWVKSRRRLDNAEAVAQDEPETRESHKEFHLVVTRTFLHYQPAPLDSVTQSTTEAHGGDNPRRKQAGIADEL